MEVEFESLIIKTLHALSRNRLRGVKSDRVKIEFARPLKVIGDVQSPADALDEIVPHVSSLEPELRGGGLQTRPSDGARGLKAWLIFARVVAGPDEQASPFEPVGGIGAALPVSHFVATAYQYILGRSVDFDGLQNHVQLIETGRLSRQNFLMALATSEEAKDRNRQILIVPAQSRHGRSDALPVKGALKSGLFATPTSGQSLNSDVFSGEVITLKFN